MSEEIKQRAQQCFIEAHLKISMEMLKAMSEDEIEAYTSNILSGILAEAIIKNLRPKQRNDWQAYETRFSLPVYILMTDELPELLKAAYVEGFHAAHKVFVTNNFIAQAGEKCPS